jgi:phenylpropionate dioxygenase-like ring-hydroxylating dioxygenase large terminal subunit
MVQITGARIGTSRFPYYDGAVLGLERFWYPVMWSRELRNVPVALTLFGERVAFVREHGKPAAFAFEQDGATVRTYPLEERAGLVWIYNGRDEPPPLAAQIPDELLRDDAVVEGRITSRRGDWRYAAENGFDEGHVKYLHRNAWLVTFTHIPSYVSVEVGPDREGDPWITRHVTAVNFEAHYPGLGVWPKRRFWKRKKKGARISIRLPGMLRVDYGSWMHFETYVPTKPGEHRYIQLAVAFARGLEAARFRAFYRAYLWWIFHIQFNDQDAAMVELMRTPPEQLYRPDVSLIAWRRLCEEHGRWTA